MAYAAGILMWISIAGGVAAIDPEDSWPWPRRAVGASLAAALLLGAALVSRRAWSWARGGHAHDG